MEFNDVIAGNSPGLYWVNDTAAAARGDVGHVAAAEATLEADVRSSRQR